MKRKHTHEIMLPYKDLKNVIGLHVPNRNDRKEGDLHGPETSLLICSFADPEHRGLGCKACESDDPMTAPHFDGLLDIAITETID